MQLCEFSLIDQVIEATDVFKAIETVIPPEVIEQTIGNTAAKEERARKLPSSLVVCLVIAMSRWSNDSMTTVLKNLVSGKKKLMHFLNALVETIVEAVAQGDIDLLLEIVLAS